jgi:hypothetical protein
MKFEVDNNISEVVRRMLTKMKIEGINSKNLKKKLRREPKKNTSKRPIRQKTAMYSKVPFNVICTSGIMPMKGIEPSTSALPRKRSTNELQRLTNNYT